MAEGVSRRPLGPRYLQLREFALRSLAIGREIDVYCVEDEFRWVDVQRHRIPRTLEKPRYAIHSALIARPTIRKQEQRVEEPKRRRRRLMDARDDDEVVLARQLPHARHDLVAGDGVEAAGQLVEE